MKVSELITILQQHSSLDVIGHDDERGISEIDVQLKKIISMPLLQVDGTFKDGEPGNYGTRTIRRIARIVDEYSVENLSVYWENNFTDIDKRVNPLARYLADAERYYKRNVETLRRLNEAEWVVSISCK